MKSTTFFLIKNLIMILYLCACTGNISITLLSLYLLYPYYFRKLPDNPIFNPIKLPHLSQHARSSYILSQHQTSHFSLKHTYLPTRYLTPDAKTVATLSLSPLHIKKKKPSTPVKNEEKKGAIADAAAEN